MDQPTATPASETDPLVAALAEWRAQVEKDLKGAPFEKRLVTRTPEGIAIQPLYTRRDLPVGLDPTEAPAQGSLRRGLRPTAAAQGCRRLQAINRPDATAFNKALREALMNGQDAVVLPDASAAWSPRTLDGLTMGLVGVELTAVPVHVPCAGDPLGAAAMLLAYAREQGIAWTSLTGSVAADPIGAAVTSGKAPTEWTGAMDDVAGWLKWTGEYAPGLRGIAVDAGIWTDAGANAAQELAFALATTADYLREMDRRGIAAVDVLRGLVVKFGIGSRFFMELAKFRAWRVLLAKLLAALELEAGAAGSIEVQARTSKSNKTRLDVHVNMLRVTTESLSAVLGGVDGLQIDPFDTPNGEPSVLAERVARNLHLLLVDEFGFAEPGDAAGGSWFVENLTDELARKSWAIFRSIEGKGGMRAALAEGWPQAQVGASAATRDRDYATRKSGLLGSNLFPNLRDPAPVAPVVEIATASGVEPTSSGQSRSWPDCINAATVAVRDGVSIDEFAANGPLAGPTVNWPELASYRAAKPFEDLRIAAAAWAEKHEKAPTVFLARMGPVKQHKPRADFAAGFLAVAGIGVTGNAAYSTAEEAAIAAIASDAQLVVICSTDDTYPDLVPAIASTVKAARPNQQVIVAGAPKDAAQEEVFRAAGVDEFIHVRSDLPATLGRVLANLPTNL